MIEETSSFPSDISGREIVTTRIFDAPRERVFEAFSDPVQLKRWWGPDGFTSSIEVFELRPGGRWLMVMHGPDGTDYPSSNTFLQTVKPERIVFLHHQPPSHDFRMTMLYTEANGNTQLSWHMLFDSADEYARLRGVIAAANEQNFNRLEAFLKITHPTKS